MSPGPSRPRPSPALILLFCLPTISCGSIFSNGPKISAPPLIVAAPQAQIRVPAPCREAAGAELPPPAASDAAPDPGPFPQGDPLSLAYWKAVALWYKASAQFWKADAIAARGAREDLRIDKNACAEGLAGQ